VLIAVNHQNKPCGQAHALAKTTDREVALACQLHEQGLSLREIARKFDVTHGAVGHWVSGRRRGSIPAKVIEIGSYSHGPMQNPAKKGAGHHRARFDDSAVRAAIARVAAGESMKAVAKDIGAPVQTVFGWVHGEARSSLAGGENGR